MITAKILKLNYTSPLFEQALIKAGIPLEMREEIIRHVMENGTCQGVKEVPEAIRNTFVVSADVSAEEHVRMQAALQAFVDNSLSKTINFPVGASPENVARAYKLAWELGCKGTTVYVTGSREKVVLETLATAKQKDPTAVLEPLQAPVSQSKKTQLTMWGDKKKPRPLALRGYTLSISTPLGKAFVTINENGGNQPFEVFINTSKAGSDTAAVSEAIGRLCSYILRLASPVAPRERLKEIVRQLSGIGGGRSLGFGPNRVRSLPDGVAQAIGQYLESTELRSRGRAYTEEPIQGNGFHPTSEISHLPEQPFLKIGDLCPECGQAAVVNEEGCRKCYACAFSEC
jgi:ribonucleoside-diphosphate reductase alpha chain